MRAVGRSCCTAQGPRSAAGPRPQTPKGSVQHPGKPILNSLLFADRTPRCPTNAFHWANGEGQGSSSITF